MPSNNELIAVLERAKQESLEGEARVYICGDRPWPEKN
jgi:hypothetical protein